MPDDKHCAQNRCPRKLYVEVVAHDADGHKATVVIAREHTHYIYVAKDDEVLCNEPLQPNAHAGACGADIPTAKSSLQLTLRKVWEYATTMPLDEISFINEARRLNGEAARLSLQGNYGHCLGKALSRPLGRGIMGDSIYSHIISSTACACDARMAGAMIPVMSNSGSGNQGICATNPVVVFAEENHNTAEEMTRASCCRTLRPFTSSKTLAHCRPCVAAWWLLQGRAAALPT